MKKLTKVFLAAGLMFSLVLTGCGDTQESGSNASSSDESVTQENDQEDNNASDGEDEETQLTTVRYGVMTSNISQQLSIVGLEKGIYEKHGLSVETTEYAAGINTVDALVTGQLDIGFVADFAGINRIGNTSDVSNLRFFSTIARTSSDLNYVTQLYVNPEKIKDLSDLKGKKIITLLGTVWEYWNAKAVEEAGLTADDVEYQAVDSAQNGLAVASSGDADAFWASGENAKRLQEYGWESILSASDLGIDTYQIYMASEEYLEANQETVQKFIEATQEIIDYINANQDDAAEIIYDKTGMEKDVFINALNSVELDTAFDQDVYDGLYEINSWAYENGYYTNEYKIEDYINTDALKAAFPDKVSWTAK